ncbi:hypothetical protein vseg_008149 [Gypsophila vaccaria]
MARKSSHMKHREINLRGRNIVHSLHQEEEEKTEHSNGTVQGTEDPCAGLLGDGIKKTKDINSITRIPGIAIEDDTEEGEVSETRNQIETLTEQSIENQNKEEDPTEPILQLQMEDVAEEIEYWSQAVVCYIMGANPPWDIIEGFIRRIWSKYNIDKLSFMPNSIFLVRFKTMEMKEQVMQSGHFMFDNKPLIYRPWSKEVELKKIKIEEVPVWIRLHHLPLKFWGKSLPKIAGLIGKYVKGDYATEERNKIGYARVMLELKIDQRLPDTVTFKDELGNLIKVEVEYEWKPASCSKCQGMGHSSDQCRKAPSKPAQKPVTKKIWKPVTKTSTIPEVKVLTQIHPVINTRKELSQPPDGEVGYSPSKFGSVSYREALSPTIHEGHITGKDHQSTNSYG